MKTIKVNAQQTVIRRNRRSVFRSNGWPTVCSDERGVLYAAASSFRIAHGNDPSGKNAMFVSFNSGETWTKPIVVNDSYLDDRDTGIISLGGGRMIISWFSQYSEGEAHANYEWEKDYYKAMIINMGKVLPLLPPEDVKPGAYVKVSDDYGVTWSEPIPVPMTAPHGPTKMNDGRAVFLGRSMTPRAEGESMISAYISNDYGRTWERQGDVPLPAHEELTWDHLHEPHVVQLPNGRLLGAIRVHCRKVEPADTVYTTFSDDEGKTWTMPECIGVSGLPPHLLVHSSGAVILSYGCRVDGQQSEHACVSYDNGETWAEDYVISESGKYDLGYPATAECADGSLYTVYYEDRPEDEYDCCCIVGSKWKLEK